MKRHSIPSSIIALSAAATDRYLLSCFMITAMVIAQLLTLTGSGLDQKHQILDTRQLRLTHQVASFRETPSGCVTEEEQLTEKELKRLDAVTLVRASKLHARYALVAA